jgi:hypothetical protein
MVKTLHSVSSHKDSSVNLVDFIKYIIELALHKVDEVVLMTFVIEFPCYDYLPTANIIKY